MALFILVIIFLIIVIFLAEAGILLLVEKLFKTENPTYKNSLKILVFSCIISIIIGIIFSLVNFKFNILSLIILFFSFGYFNKRYYLSTWKKSLGIYVVFGIIYVITLFVVVTPTRLYILEPFIVKGRSMSPTYNNGDYLLINRFNKSFERGDVIVFLHPKNQNQFILERIIGLPSEEINIRDGKVFINKQILNEGYSIDETLPNSSTIINQDQYFVLGDNRYESSDSRDWGSIAKSSIQGKILYKVPGLIKLIDYKSSFTTKLTE